MQHLLKVYLLIQCVCLLFSADAVSQTYKASINGVVADPMGAIVPGAKVKVFRLAEGTLQPNVLLETETDCEGTFTINDLPLGTYESQVSTPAFGNIAKKNFTVAKPITSQIEIKFLREVLQGCAEGAIEPGALNDEDKGEIVSQLLTDVFRPPANLLMDEQRSGKVILSTKNINPKWVPVINGVSFVLLNAHEIQRKANHDGDFLYLSFPTFKVKGTCVVVTISNTWAVGKHSGIGYLSGGGTTYEFRKKSGKWVRAYL